MSPSAPQLLHYHSQLSAESFPSAFFVKKSSAESQPFSLLTALQKERVPNLQLKPFRFIFRLRLATGNLFSSSAIQIAAFFPSSPKICFPNSVAFYRRGRFIRSYFSKKRFSRNEIFIFLPSPPPPPERARLSASRALACEERERPNDEERKRSVYERGEERGMLTLTFLHTAVRYVA